MISRFTFFVRPAALSVAVTLFAASIAVAQTREPTYPTGAATQAAVGGVPTFASQLQGKNVWITADGARVRGRVTSLSPTGLVLVEDGAPTTIPYAKIVRVEKSSHRLRNGTLIGLVAGAAVGLGAVAGCGWEDCEEGIIILPAFFTGIGAAAGVGFGAIVNAAQKSGDVLYDARRRTTTMALSPILSPTRKGLAFSMTWR